MYRINFFFFLLSSFVCFIYTRTNIGRIRTKGPVCKDLHRKTPVETRDLLSTVSHYLFLYLGLSFRPKIGKEGSMHWVEFHE